MNNSRVESGRLWSCRAAAVLALVALSVLGGCTSRAETQRQQAFCPKGFMVGDATSMTRFKPGPGRDPTDVQFRAEVVKIESTCSFDKNGVEIETKVTIGVLEGPAAVDRQANFGYFVAILDGSRKVVARQEFTADFKFEGNRNRLASVDELTERLPGLTSKDTPNYQIVVGLLVSPDELNYNRQRTR